MHKARLTDTQQRVFDFVVGYAKKNGLPPTRADIAKYFKWASATSAQQHLSLIAKKGYLRLNGAIHRGIEIL